MSFSLNVWMKLLVTSRKAHPDPLPFEASVQATTAGDRLSSKALWIKEFNVGISSSSSRSDLKSELEEVERYRYIFIYFTFYKINIQYVVNKRFRVSQSYMLSLRMYALVVKSICKYFNGSEIFRVSCRSINPVYK